MTVWAKTDDGQEATRTYTVSNYDPYAGDVTPPSGSSSLSTTSWTTNPVTINVSATDTQSGVASIVDPTGNTYNTNTCSYIAPKNGTYNFVLKDNAGNTANYPVTVSNIDNSISITHPINMTYSYDPNTGKTTMPDFTLINNNSHIAAKITLSQLTSSLIGTNGFHFGIKVLESSSGNTTWSEIDNASIIAAGSSPTVLGVLSPNGTGHLLFNASADSLKWDDKNDTGSVLLTFNAVS